MKVWLERFVLSVLAAILVATVLYNPWKLSALMQVGLIALIVAISLVTAWLCKKEPETMEVVESLAEEMFGTGNLPTLNKTQASGLIDELLSRYGKKPRRDATYTVVGTEGHRDDCDES